MSVARHLDCGRSDDSAWFVVCASSSAGYTFVGWPAGAMPRCQYGRIVTSAATATWVVIFPAMAAASCRACNPVNRWKFSIAATRAVATDRGTTKKINAEKRRSISRHRSTDGHDGSLVPPVGIEPTPDDYKSTARPSCYGGQQTYREGIIADSATAIGAGLGWMARCATLGLFCRPAAKNDDLVLSLKNLKF